MSIVDKIYKENIDISDIELAEEIIKHKELDIIDLWLLPQYPFDEWRKKYDYPQILSNIKSRQWKFQEWMNEYKITDEILIDGYISSFLEHKPKTDTKDKFNYIIKVSYKGIDKIQIWNSYDGKTQSKGDGEPVLYEYIGKFIPYYDWCLSKGKQISLIDTFDRYEPNTVNEQVYLNSNIRLLKMGGIRPPTNSINILLRGKKLEFVNVAGLELKGTIYFGDMGNLSFHHCAIDNIKCNELDMPLIDFYYSSIQNTQINNSNISSWDFINCFFSGNIINSKLNSIRIYSGQFLPNFINSEIDKFSINTEWIPCPNDFEKTYRSLFKGAIESNNNDLVVHYKLLEKEFIRKKTKGLRRIIMWINKNYWGYGYEPYRLLYFTIISIIVFGIFYSFFPALLNLKVSDSYLNHLGNSIYYSIITFTTLGYGDISPSGFLKPFAAFEALLGVITIGFLVTGLARIRE